MLRLAEDERFVASVAAEPDYEEPVLRKAHHILTSRQLGEYEHGARLEKLMSQVFWCRQHMHVYSIMHVYSVMHLIVSGMLAGPSSRKPAHAVQFEPYAIMLTVC